MFFTIHLDSRAYSIYPAGTVKVIFLDIPYYDGDKLAYGMEVDGPAIVVLLDTTIVIPPQFRILAQERGYYVMEVPV